MEHHLPVACRLRQQPLFWKGPKSLQKQQSSNLLSTRLRTLPCQLLTKREPGIRLLLLPPSCLQMTSSLDLPARRVLAVHLAWMTAGILCRLTAAHLAQQVALTELLFNHMALLNIPSVHVMLW